MINHLLISVFPLTTADYPYQTSPYTNNQQEDGDGRSQGTYHPDYQQPSPPLNNELPDGRSQQNKVGGDCLDYSILNNAVPHGGAKTPHEFLGIVSSVNDCVQLCCRSGPNCHYAWLFEGKCYSISCDIENVQLCKPEKVQFQSTYIWIEETSGKQTTPLNTDGDTPTNQILDTSANKVTDTPTTEQNEPNSTTIGDSITTPHPSSALESTTLIHQSVSTEHQPTPTQLTTSLPTPGKTNVPVVTPPSSQDTGQSNDNHLLHKS